MPARIIENVSRVECTHESVGQPLRCKLIATDNLYLDTVQVGLAMLDGVDVQAGVRASFTARYRKGGTCKFVYELFQEETEAALLCGKGTKAPKRKKRPAAHSSGATGRA